MANPCAQQLKRLLGDIVDTELAESIVKRLEGLAKAELRTNPGGTIESALESVTQKMLDGIHAESLNQIRVALKDAEALTKAWRYVSSGKDDEMGKRLMDLAGARTWGSNTGAAYGSGVQMKALQRRWGGQIWGELEAKGLYADFKNPDNEKAIAHELMQLSKGENGTPGSSGNARAKEVAAILKNGMEEMRSANNSRGAHIASLEDFIVRNMHNDAAIRRAGLDQWSADMLRWVDASRTFQGKDPDEWMQEAYKSFVAGRWDRSRLGDAGELTQGDMTGGGTKSLAHRLNAERKIFWKDAASMVEYNRKYGSGHLENTIAAMVRDNSRSVAIMENFGVNADRNWKILRQKIENRLRASTSTEAGKGQRVTERLNTAALDAAWHNLTGGADRPENIGRATFFNAWRAWKGLTIYGPSAISSIADRATIQNMARLNGMSWMEAAFKQAHYLLPRSPELKKFLRQELVGVEARIGHIARFMDDSFSPSGFTSWAQTKFFKANLQQFVTENGRFAAAEILGNNLADNTGKSFDSLSGNLQASLRRHGIEAAEWDAIRTVEGVVPPGRNEKLFFPRLALEISDETIAAMQAAKGAPTTPKAIEAARNDLYSRLGTYFSDEIDTGVPERGLAQDVVLKGSGVAGRWASEFRRSAFQGKSFPIAVWQKHHLREIYRHGHSTMKEGFRNNGGSILFWTAALAAQAAMLGYMRNAIIALMEGKTPPEVVDQDGKVNVETVQRAFYAGGGVGILGDVLFSDLEDRARKLDEAAFGPTWGDIKSVLGVAGKLQNYALGKEGAELPVNETIKLLKSAVPGSNLFYMRYLLNRLVIWHIEEYMSPGKALRNESMLEDTGQEYFLPGPVETVN